METAQGWTAAVGMLVGVVVWLIRLEGRVNLLQALSVRQESASERIEEKLDRLMEQLTKAELTAAIALRNAMKP